MNCRGDLSPCNNDSESGRSLVEMLGTLAVMGVLTIGGIAGFNYAMDKSKANDILDGINKRAVALSTYTLLGTNITASSLSAEFPNKIGDSTVAVAAEGDGFNLTVSGVSDSVCDKVLDAGLKMASKISLGETMVWNGSAKSDHACAEENTITFAFNAALDNTMTCGYCQHAENNTCVADETCDNGCPGDSPMKDKYGDCYSCLYPRFAPASATECAKCPNRVMQDGKCILPCSDEEYRDRYRFCRSCDDSNVYEASEEECHKCPDRFISTTGECYSCNTRYGGSATEEECGRCSNRMMMDGKCVQKCSDGQFRAVDSPCYSCDIDYAANASEEECHKCSERFMSTSGYCYPCNDAYDRPASENECNRCANREMYNGKCVLK